jgi:hypothetical protein
MVFDSYKFDLPEYYLKRFSPLAIPIFRQVADWTRKVNSARRQKFCLPILHCEARESSVVFIINWQRVPWYQIPTFAFSILDSGGPYGI